MDKKDLLDIPLDEKEEEDIDKKVKEKNKKEENKDEEDDDDGINVSFKGYHFKMPKKK